jgi:hypothetical protein
MFSRTSRILLVAAALLAGVYFLIERPRQRASDRAEQERAQLASFVIARIDSVVLERPDETLRFQKSDSLWRMISPLRDAAEPSAIASLLDALNTADIDRHLGAEGNPAGYGLDHPDAVITLASSGGIVLHVSVGKHTVDDAWCYARSSANDVVLIPTDVHHAATLPVDAYRNRRVLDFQLRNVGAYSLRADDHATAWTRHGRRWVSSSTGRDSIPGDSVAVESVLRRLRGLRVASFVDEPGTGASPAPGSGSIDLWRPGGALLASIRFSRAPDGTWHADDGVRRVVLDDDVSDLFQHTTNELRDRRLLQFSPPDAQRIVFTSPAHSGELVRAGGRWSFPNAASGGIDAEHAADFIRALRGLKWSEPLTTPHAVTRDRASFTISLRDTHDRILDDLSAEPQPGSPQWWVTSRSSRGTWLVEGARLDDLSNRFARLKVP